VGDRDLEVADACPPLISMDGYLILRRPGARALASGNVYRGIERDRPGGLDELCPDHPVTRANAWYTSAASSDASEASGTSTGLVHDLAESRALVDAYARWGYGDFEIVHVHTLAPPAIATDSATASAEGRLLGFDVASRSLLRSALRAATSDTLPTLNGAGLFDDPAVAAAWLAAHPSTAAGGVPDEAVIIAIVLVHPLPPATPADDTPAPTSTPSLRIL
jgi:hypothetical protein